MHPQKIYGCDCEFCILPTVFTVRTLQYHRSLTGNHATHKEVAKTFKISPPPLRLRPTICKQWTEEQMVRALAAASEGSYACKILIGQQPCMVYPSQPFKDQISGRVVPGRNRGPEWLQHCRKQKLQPEQPREGMRCLHYPQRAKSAEDSDANACAICQ